MLLNRLLVHFLNVLVARARAQVLHRLRLGEFQFIHILHILGCIIDFLPHFTDKLFDLVRYDLVLHELLALLLLLCLSLIDVFLATGASLLPSLPYKLVLLLHFDWHLDLERKAHVACGTLGCHGLIVLVRAQTDRVIVLFVEELN